MATSSESAKNAGKREPLTASPPHNIEMEPRMQTLLPLLLTAAAFLSSPVRATEVEEIDPGSCETRIFFQNVRPEYEAKILEILESKGYIDVIRRADPDRKFSHYHPVNLTLTVGLVYTLNVPTSNFVTLRYSEYIPLPEAPLEEEYTYFSVSNWTLGHSSVSACEATTELLKSLPKCMGWDSPLHKANQK